MKDGVLLTIIGFSIFFVAFSVWADGAHGGDGRDSAGLWLSSRPGGHAPIGVMGDHIHEKGEWMTSYRYMHMDMDGFRDGSNRVSADAVLNDFMVAPIKMRMEMHMAGLMYAVSDELTLMAMAPYSEKKMDHRNRAGVQFTTASKGMGDINLTGLYALVRGRRQQVHFNAGLSFPTGSIDKSDDTPAGANSKLPYPMQLGSGTYDLLPGLTYLGQTDSWSWGAQAIGTVRVGTNSNEYTLGDRIDSTVWLAYKWSGWLSTSLRVAGHMWGDIDGQDPGINSTMAPTGDPSRQGGKRVDLGVGFNCYARKGWFEGHRLAVEAEFPFYQSLEGPQMETDWKLTTGWQLVF